MGPEEVVQGENLSLSLPCDLLAHVLGQPFERPLTFTQSVPPRMVRVGGEDPEAIVGREDLCKCWFGREFLDLCPPCVPYPFHITFEGGPSQLLGVDEERVPFLYLLLHPLQYNLQGLVSNDTEELTLESSQLLQ